MTDDRGRKASRDARVPPHSLEAERSVLGAALLAPSAVDALVSGTDVADFYKPAHQHIAHAIRTLTSVDSPVDVVTVGDQLRRDGLLDSAGGIPALLELQNDTPSVSSAARYAKIVHDAGILRRLIDTAASITEAAYGHHDPPAALAHAGQLLDRLTSNSVVDDDFGWDIADIAALLAGDLEPEEATLLRRTDGAGLLYPGKVHNFQAEPTSGKSWIACYLCAEVLELGGSALYLDNEDTGHGILRRMIQVGASPAALRTRFAYRQLTSRFGPAQKLSLDRILDELNPDVVIIDGVAEALTREGLSEDKADDIVRWFDLFPRPIARTGAAVALLDHVSKDPEQRGRWARGSGAKLAAVDGTAYQVKVRTPWSRHRAGKAQLVVAKDRPGGVGAVGDIVADISVEPHGAGARVSMRFDPHVVDQAPSDTFKPTIIMGTMFRTLSEAPVPLTATGLLNLTGSKPSLKKEALQRLLMEGYIAENSGRPKTLRIAKPWDGAGAPNAQAPAWREPPPELFEPDHDEPDTDDPVYRDHLDSFTKGNPDGY